MSKFVSWIPNEVQVIAYEFEWSVQGGHTLLNDSKYSGELVNAANAASWKGAGAQSVILIWMFWITDAKAAGAIAHPTLQPNPYVKEKLNTSNQSTNQVAKRSIYPRIK